MTSAAPVVLTVKAEARFARLVRMTASNIAMLSSMSVERVEDIRMAAEEAFVYACATQPGGELAISFEVDETHVTMTFTLGVDTFAEPTEDDPTSVYVDLILGSVCDSYEKRTCPAALVLDLEADV